MASKYLFTAGVANVKAFVGDALVMNANTLSTSSINFNVSSAQLRGGQSNALFGQYFYDSAMTVDLTDIMFSLDWLALNTGSVVTNGSDIFETEKIVLSAGGNGTVTGTPVAIDTYGTIGWASKPDENSWTRITFSGKDFNVPGAVENDTYCVLYQSTQSAARKIVVSSTFIPQTVKLVMTGLLYAGEVGATPTGLGENSTIAGRFEIVIPRFQFSGTQQISLTSTGVANTPMSGNALATATVDCSNSGYYAIITEYLNNANWYDNVIDIAVAGGNIELAVGGDQTLAVRAIPQSGAAYTVANSNFTFTSKDPAVATVNEQGLVTAVAAGETAVTVTVTDKPDLEGIAYVTVTAL